jgi:hypothetical protein
LWIETEDCRFGAGAQSAIDNLNPHSAIVKSEITSLQSAIDLVHLGSAYATMPVGPCGFASPPSNV